ncbi:tetratricopeptide repeat domain-containing protein [Aphelenchoides avenae]|nr:tetratricopeptide repeat domain-containing protein [Aphelenchus avenae]
MVPPPSTPPNLRLWSGISLGPDVREESAEERGSQFYKEGRYQDAVDAYSLAIVYNVSAKTLSNRSQAYIKLGKYGKFLFRKENSFHWFAYIDANEAVKLDDSLSKAWYRRGATLAELGLYNEAKKSLRKCLKLVPHDKATTKLLNHIESKKADEPKIDTRKVANYDPLESDSPAYGREFFLGDLNRYLLNNRTPPTNLRLKKFRYSVKTWKTAPELSETFCKLAMDARGREDFEELGTLRLCFTLDYVALLNRSVAHMAAKRFLMSYIDACVCFDAAVKLVYPEGLLLSCAYKSAALNALGFVQRSKKALDPAMRFDTQIREVLVCSQAMAGKKKDDPKIDPTLLDNYDPLAGEGFAYDQRRKVYTGLLKAMEKVYHEEPGPFWPNTSIRELEWHITNEGLRAMRSDNFVDAAVLLSVVIKVSDRTDYVLLANRARASLHGPLIQCAYSAYIDASEALKLRPNYEPAMYFKSLALFKLGLYERMRECIRLLRRYDPNLEAEQLNKVLAKVAGMPDRPLLAATMLDEYDPRHAGAVIVEDAHDACDMLAVLNEVKGDKCLKEGDVEKALEHLNRALCCSKPPGALCLRARALLKAKRYLNAYADAVRAAKDDPTCLEAVELKGQCLAAMGYFTKAHTCFREVLKFDPRSDDVRQRLGTVKNKRDRFVEDPSLVQEVEESFARTCTCECG